MKTIIAQPPAASAVPMATQPGPASVPWALASLSLSMLLASLGTSIANVGLPGLAVAFDAAFSEIQWVVLAYLLAITTLIVSVGRLGDMVGRRRLLLAGLILFTLASALCAAAPTLGVLIAARAVQGLGAAIMMALTLAFVGETVPKENTGRAMGLLATMSAAGTAAGPGLGGFIIAAFGWRGLFLAIVPLGILTLLLAHRSLPNDRPNTQLGRVPLDIAGTLLLAVSIAAFALVATIGHGHFDLLNIGLLFIAGLGMWAFIQVETKVAAPLIPLAVFRSPSLCAGLATSALVATVLMATLVVGPFYLSLALGLDAVRVGLVISVGPVVVALTGLPAGRLTDYLGARRVTMLGLLGIAAGCVAMAVIPAALGIGGYIIPLIIITAGYALFQTANNTAVMADIAPDRRGVISGLLNLSRNLGLIGGAACMGAVFALGSTAADITLARPEDVASGMRVTFAVAALLIAGAVAILVAGTIVTHRTHHRTDTI